MKNLTTLYNIKKKIMKQWDQSSTDEKNENNQSYENSFKKENYNYNDENLNNPNDNANIIYNNITERNRNLKTIIIFILSLLVESLLLMLVWNKIITNVIPVTTLTYFQSFFIYLLAKVILK